MSEISRLYLNEALNTREKVGLSHFAPLSQKEGVKLFGKKRKCWPSMSRDLGVPNTATDGWHLFPVFARPNKDGIVARNSRDMTMILGVEARQKHRLDELPQAGNQSGVMDTDAISG